MPRKKLHTDGNPKVDEDSDVTYRGDTHVFVNCQGIQIGNKNVLVSSTSQDKAQADSDEVFKDKRGNYSKEKLSLLFLKEILNNHDQPILYSELEEKVIEKVKFTDGKSFKELSGWYLENFLIKYKDDFDIFTRKTLKHVRLKRKKQNRCHLMNVQTPSSTIYQNEEYMENIGTSTSHPQCGTNNESSVTNSKFNHKEDTTDEWTIVKRKKRSHRNGNDIRHNADSDSHVYKDVYDFDECTFASLMRRGEGSDILHISSFKVYEENPLLFSQNIVGMWNTPNRRQSYIVIGIESGVLHGIKEPIDDDLCQKLFSQIYFSNKPTYKCYNACYNDKLFGVIQLSSSFGTGTPCAVRQTISDTDIKSEIGDIWVRKGHRHVIYKTTNVELTSVYQWFLGSVTESMTNFSESIRRSETESVKMTIRPTLNYQDTSAESEGCSLNRPVAEKTFAYFWNSVNQFRKGHFVLIAGDVPNTTKDLEALALPPWICVYDFDVFSNSSGLLNVVQDRLEKERHLRLRTWKDPSENISEHGTWWCFMRGREEIGDSRTDLVNNAIEDIHVWMKHVSNGLYSNCETLARFREDYTVLTLVVLWPQNEKLLQFIYKFLDRLYETLTCSANIVICLSREPQTPKGKTRLDTLREDFHGNISICQLDFQQLCQGIRNNISLIEGNCVEYTLPTNEIDTPSLLTETDAAWLREDFEVLYLSNPYTKSSADDEDVEEEINTFFKGGNLHWFAWYKTENKGNQIPIERTTMNIIQDKIKTHIEEFKTTIITLYHSPGAGGTTLAQSVLWTFHDRVPCIHMKLRTGSNIDELVKKISFLNDKTDLPTLLLIDGEEESKVRYLSRRLKYTIILYVKRYPYPIRTVEVRNTVYLSGFVTHVEASRLATKLGERQDKNKKKALSKLKDDVCTHGIKHHLFEFGMTIHLHEFKGIVSYVQGYLQLENVSPNTELFPWQKCLGYLALVYYYGQSSVPCQFFAGLFGKPSNYIMALEDFPYPIQEFVVYDTNESCKNNLRICHFIVAKEILEQLLSRKFKHSKERSERLSLDACRNLSKLCLDFIEYASRKKSRNHVLSTTIRFILTKTFIFRDDKDMSENQEQVRRKPVLSKLMIDIPGGQPLFTERLGVLQKLSSSFPDDPNFWAHLGRFYAYCRPDDEKEAEKCFIKALELCDKQCQGRRDEDIDEWLKLSMMHIYHMYGIVKQRYVSKYTRRSQREKAVAFDEELVFYETMEEIVPIAEDACELFRKSRDITPETHQVYTYAYTGEIQVRLQICDFVLRHFDSESGVRSISAFFASTAHSDCKLFVQNSISAIENLILECYTDVDLVGDDTTGLRTQVAWYNSLFKKSITSIKPLKTENGISERRLQIAATKLKYGMNNNLAGMENIDNEKDINGIIDLYEENFNDVHMFGFQSIYKQRDFDRESREWILAIRHEKVKKNYSLEDVLSHVERWHSLVKSPFSMFYLFILRSLLGFGTEDTPGKTDCLVDAIAAKEELGKMTHLVIRPKYPREWLGVSGEGIKNLIPGKRHVGVSNAEDSSVTNVCMSNLAVCKGIILHPNTNKVGGLIEFRLHFKSVKVFFIPKYVNLVGKRYVGRKVEFKLAFTVRNGYEAYNVKLLKRYGCSSCNAKLEFTSADNVLKCKCGNQVHKDEINEIR